MGKTYTYEAVSFGGNGWIVKRFDENNLCSEAEIFDAKDKEEAIQKAIGFGTWA